METFGHESQSLTPWLTGAGALSAERTNIGHQNREAMAYVGVRVEPPVRLAHVVEGRGHTVASGRQELRDAIRDLL